MAAANVGRCESAGLKVPVYYCDVNEDQGSDTQEQTRRGRGCTDGIAVQKSRHANILRQVQDVLFHLVSSCTLEEKDNTTPRKR